MIRVAFLLLLVATEASSQCSGGIPAAEVQGFLDAHNSFRRSISAGTYVAKGKLMPAASPAIPDLTYDCSIEASAQAVSDTCVFAHSTNRVNLGENLYTYQSSAQVSFAGKGKAASDSWADEFQQFGWADINLTQAAFNTGIGHATQMAWAKSTKIGCGMTLCQAGKQVIVACQYRDQGNYLNQNVYPPAPDPLATTTTTTAAPSLCSGGIPSSEVQGFIDSHNALRRSISAGTYVAKGKLMPAASVAIPDLTYDCSIEASAQAVSDTCVFAHSTNRVNLGENLYTYQSSAQVSFTGKGKAASDSWADEFQQFGWADINLTQAVFNTGIGHATQMAWAKSTKIGCGMTLCQAGKQVLVACQYRDQGNYLNQNIYEPAANPLATTTTTTAAPARCAGGIPTSEAQGFLDAHNTFRQSISSGTFLAKGKLMPAASPAIPDLTWDCSIEASAQAVSDTCVFQHSTNRVNLGENLYIYTSSALVSFAGKGKASSDSWADEFQQFGWADINLTQAVFNTGIGHATQMAWAKSTKIGCGMTLCQAGKQVLVACQYRDQGNYLNQNVYPPAAQVPTSTSTTTLASTTTSGITTTADPSCPPEGVWGEWTTTGVCAGNCGACNMAPRIRTCSTKNGNCPCAGDTEDIGPCGIALCTFPAKTCCGTYIKTLRTFEDGKVGLICDKPS